ncbi:MAG: hypothetical protein QG596_1291 [Actinomycetota bacterium]|jgi:hypothetical protein|nr:hypothetical protein [Actinomycetota bacterium]
MRDAAARIILMLGLGSVGIFAFAGLAGTASAESEANGAAASTILNLSPELKDLRRAKGKKATRKARRSITLRKKEISRINRTIFRNCPGPKADGPKRRVVSPA